MHNRIYIFYFYLLMVSTRVDFSDLIDLNKSIVALNQIWLIQKACIGGHVTYLREEEKKNGELF